VNFVFLNVSVLQQQTTTTTKQGKVQTSNIDIEQQTTTKVNQKHSTRGFSSVVFNAKK